MKPKRRLAPSAARPSDLSPSAKLALQIASTGNATDIDLAALLARHPLPWKFDAGIAIGQIPALRRTHPRRADKRYYEHFTVEEIRVLCRVTVRYVRMIADSELATK